MRAPRPKAERKPAPAPSRTSAAASPGKQRPLLVIDGDSFAHRAYHALPKTILRSDGSPAGAILGFANFLLRFYQAEQPRAVLVGWDTLEEPTYRHEQFPGYQSGREFDDAIVEQLDVLPELVAACGFANAKAAGYEADDFLASAAAREERRGGIALVASGDRDTFQLASERTTILYPVRAGEMARISRRRCASATASIRSRCRTSSPCAAIRPTSCRARATSARRAPPTCCVATARSKLRLPRDASHGSRRLRLYRDIATMNRKAPLPPLRDQKPTWAMASAHARGWGLNQLADRLAAMATEPAQVRR